jgi:amidophosphoribosyltransferase
MCGIIGILLANEREFANQLLFDGLTVLQHRGQDAAGMVTSEAGGRRESAAPGEEAGGDDGRGAPAAATRRPFRLHLRKDNGLVKDVFQLHHMLELRGNVGIGHCRYPTAGTSSCAEAQPLYTNYPYGICVAHNGNITNTDELLRKLRDEVGRHINTDSDSELLLNLFAEALTKETRATTSPSNGKKKEEEEEEEAGPAAATGKKTTDAVFAALASVMASCRGGYAGLFLINGLGLVGFRDPHGIRPLVFGCRRQKPPQTVATENGGSSSRSNNNGSGANLQNQKLDYAFASESVAIDTLGFQLVGCVFREYMVFGCLCP